MASVTFLNTYSLRQQLITHPLRLDLAPLPTHAKRCVSDGNGLGVEQIACLKEMLQSSPLQYPDAVSSCHPGYTRTKDDSSTAAKTAIALCTCVHL